MPDDQDEMIAALRRVCAPLGGEPRPGQDQMARAVARAAKDSKCLVAQAGTGVGKSFAYLVPLLAAGYKTVVSTATLALQDQLDRKDLPHLHKHLGRKFRWAVLKGRSNYLCAQRWAEQQDKLIQDDIPPADLQALAGWAEKTSTGDRAEMTYEVDPAVWRLVSVGSEECPGSSKCPRGKQCWAEKARGSTWEADLIVVNHHLLVMNWLADGHILPGPDAVVIDEAHELVNTAASCLGQRLTAGGIRRYGKLAEHLLADSPQVKKLQAAATEWEAALRLAAQQVLLTKDKMPPELVQAGTRSLEAVWALTKALQDRAHGAGDWETRRDRALKYGKLLQEKLVLSTAADPDQAIWAEQGALCRQPIDVAPDLARIAWSGDIPTILCSATIPADLPLRLGLIDHVRVDAASPFDFASQGMLLVPDGIPSPKKDRAAWEATVLDRLQPLLAAARGRAMILCTSWGMLHKIREQLQKESSWGLLVQGDAPKLELLRRFKTGEGVLLGTRSFWSGIDVPGQACFTAGTLVRTGRGYIPIENVKTGDKVWTHRGRYRTVTNTMVRQYAGPMVTVRPCGSPPVSMTPEHPLFVSLPRREEGAGSQTGARFVWMAARDINLSTDLALPTGEHPRRHDPAGQERTPGHAPHSRDTQTAGTARGEGGTGDAQPGEAQYLIAKPLQVGQTWHEGAVYNLAVQQDESYSLVPFAAHNCSAVIIDKLPFSAPDQPALVALRARLEAAGGHPFSQIDLPEAAMYLAQGVGRLVRTKSDKGIVVVMDPRLLEASWGRTIVNQLPPLTVTRDTAKAIGFLSSISDQPAEPDRPAGTGTVGMFAEDEEDIPDVLAPGGPPESDSEPAPDGQPESGSELAPDGPPSGAGSDMPSRTVTGGADLVGQLHALDRDNPAVGTWALCGEPLGGGPLPFDPDEPGNCLQCAAVLRQSTSPVRQAG